MSYARFGCDGSNVYVYMDVGGWLECCGCSMMTDDCFKANSTAEMIRHLEAHLARGEIVPANVIPDLKFDDGCNFPHGPNSLDPDSTPPDYRG